MSATAKQVGGVVYSAVHTVPDQVLPIVHAAVLTSRNSDAPEIVTAAISAVPNPWKEVLYKHYVTRVEKGERDYKDYRDYKDDKDGARLGEPTFDPRDPGTRMTLAEAIVQTALDARSGLDPAALVAAADLALIGDPGYLLLAAGDPHGISAVGDAGNSNYGNEPVLPPAPPPIPPVSP